MSTTSREAPRSRIALGLIAACLLGLVISSGADAQVRKTAPEPAATLLLPYFEQDLGNASGVTTSFSINNASTLAVLAHVTIWSDLSVPVLGFNVYLTGYDVQTINLRDILVSGMIPQTASLGQDPKDTISPHGPLSQDVNFSNCANVLPTPTLSSAIILHLQQSLTGKPSSLLGGLCAGRNLGDNIARGYITVDTVSNCTFRYPSNPGYFASGGTGDATNQNVLWGDYAYTNPGAGTAEGNPLVHIVADASDPETSTLGQYTFYGRYVGWTAADNRRPLATNFAVRYVSSAQLNASTSLIVWRDSKVNQQPFTCPVVGGSRPSWYKLGQEGILIFDEQEHVTTPFSSSVSPMTIGVPPFPAEAQRVVVGSSDLPTPYSFGWFDLDLNTTVTPAGTVPPVDPAAAQAWVAVKMISGGTFSVGYDAIQLDNAAHPIHNVGGSPP